MTDTHPEGPRWAAGDKAPAVTIEDTVASGSVAWSVFIQQALARGLRFHASAGWATQTEQLHDLPGVALHGEHANSREALLEGDSALLGDALARVHLADGRAYAQVAADTHDRAAAYLRVLRELLPVADLDPEDPRVPITFWSLGQHGPVARNRLITVPRWDEIADNYVEVTTGELEPLMEGFAPGVGGQLLLWHGVPGTGKTWALRALAWEWRGWCDLHYVTDPETFFGKEAVYMLDVLLHDDDGIPDDPEDGVERPAPDPRAEHGRWRLLVLEDTGELMATDARERSGQGLSRLLNVVDGLIGQGLRVLVLVTTNEELRSLHPAMARSGRCASRVLFHPMPTAGWRAWLTARGLGEADQPGHNRAMTVADLYAALEERETSQDRQPASAGFA